MPVPCRTSPRQQSRNTVPMLKSALQRATCALGTSTRHGGKEELPSMARHSIPVLGPHCAEHSSLLKARSVQDTDTQQDAHTKNTKSKQYTIQWTPPRIHQESKARGEYTWRILREAPSASREISLALGSGNFEAELTRMALGTHD